MSATELHKHANSSVETPEINQIPKLLEDPKESKMEIDPNYESCEKSRDERSQATVPRPQIIVKSFDMPNIDCDEQVVEPIVIKQEADETMYEDYSYRCEPTSTTEKPKCQDLSKRHIVEKSHPGIENVVEKLKKNAAAALQETTPQKVDESKDKNAENLRSRKHSETIPRKLENGLKKHILRSCENSQFMEKYEVARELEVFSSENARSAKDSQDVPNYVTTTEHPCDSPTSSKHSLPRNYFLNNNNNDMRNNNDNMKLNDDKEPVVKKENVSPPEVCEVEMQCTNNNAVTPKNGKLEPLENSLALTFNNETPKSRLMINSKPKPIVDISGLELLSNSIEELERLRSNVNKRSELERSTIRGRIIFPLEERFSHNNNENSPLGVLCALAEQRFMEEVGDRTPRRSNLESSEEISHAGRLLLNLGRANVAENETKTSDKRKYVQENLQDSENLKRLKTDGELEDEGSKYDSYSEDDDCDKQYDENEREKIVSMMTENTRGSIDFSEEDDICTDDEENDVLKDAPLGTSSPCNNVNYQRDGNFEEYERKAYEQYHRSESYSSKESIDDNLSDSDAEMYDEKMCSDDKMMENDEDCRYEDRRHILGENRDCHDYRNLQAKLDAKKFIARKGHIDNDADWPNMDAMELDMRVRLADIQRQYREKQKELSKLIPKKDEKKSPGRPRKKSHSSK